MSNISTTMNMTMGGTKHKIILTTRHTDLEQQINTFLETNGDKTLLDIKYNVYVLPVGGERHIAYIYYA